MSDSIAAAGGTERVLLGYDVIIREGWAKDLHVHPTGAEEVGTLWGFGDFSGEIQRHCSVSLLNRGKDVGARFVCIWVSEFPKIGNYVDVWSLQNKCSGDQNMSGVLYFTNEARSEKKVANYFLRRPRLSFRLVRQVVKTNFVLIL